MSEQGLDVPLKLRRGKSRTDQEWLPGAVGLLKLLATSFDRVDLSTTSLLDVGCGTKFSAAILNQGIPVARYVGVDTDVDLIRFLADSVDDPRFAFHHLDSHNELYNRAGQPLASFRRLPVGDELFDIISLFSVFTHLAPHDYRAMLELVRPHVAPNGGLLFSLFINEGMDPEQRKAFNRELRRRRESGDAEVTAAIEASVAGGVEVPDFVDRIPERPLMEAFYSEPYARKLIEGTGWEIAALQQPVRPIIQHYFICRPV